VVSAEFFFFALGACLVASQFLSSYILSEFKKFGWQLVCCQNFDNTFQKLARQDLSLLSVANQVPTLVLLPKY
jgi:hypothetical protein